jgi:uncharacterized protein (TIRG00374 family)
LDQQPIHATGAENEDTALGFRFSWKLALGLALMAIFLWLSFRNIEFGKFLDALKGVSLFPVIAASVTQIVSHAVRGWRWKLMLSSSHPELRRRDAFAATMVGYSVNVIIPRGGEVVRAVFLRRIARTPLAAGLSSVLAERLLDLVALCILFPLTVWIYQHQLDRLFPGIRQGIFAVGFVAVVGLGLLWAFGRYPERMTGHLQRFLQRFWPSRAKKISEMGGNFFLGLGGLFKKETALEIGLLSGAIWLLYILSTWVLIFALPGSGISSLAFGDAAAITVIVAISFTIPSPGGTGTTHFFISRMMVGIYGIHSAHALAYATLIHLSGTLPVLIIGGALALFLKPAETNRA